MNKLKKIKQKLEIDKNGYNPIKIFLTIIKKIIRRLKYEVTEMYLFEMELTSTYNSLVNDNVKIITTPEKLIAFVKSRALEDIDCDETRYFEQIKDRFKNGDWCYAIESECGIVAVIFLSKKPVYCSAVNYIFTPPKNVCAIYDVFTLSDHRNKGYIKRIYEFALKDLSNKGFKKCWIWFMPHNYATLKAHKKVGFKNAIRKITLVQRFGLRRHKVDEINLTIDNLIEVSKNYVKDENK